MIDVDTVVGNPIKGSNSLIIPISKVVMGFASGGSEFSPNKDKMPFGGGTGGSLCINPVAFLVIGENDVKLLRMDNHNSSMKEYLPEITLKALDLIKPKNEITVEPFK